MKSTCHVLNAMRIRVKVDFYVIGKKFVRLFYKLLSASFGKFIKKKFQNFNRFYNFDEKSGNSRKVMFFFNFKIIFQNLLEIIVI